MPPADADDSPDYEPAWTLEAPEAEKILSLLEERGIRFQIESDSNTHLGAGNLPLPIADDRISLYIHKDNRPAWEKLREEYFPM